MSTVPASINTRTTVRVSVFTTTLTTTGNLNQPNIEYDDVFDSNSSDPLVCMRPFVQHMSAPVESSMRVLGSVADSFTLLFTFANSSL